MLIPGNPTKGTPIKPNQTDRVTSIDENVARFFSARREFYLKKNVCLFINHEESTMENAFENGIPLLKIFTVRDGKSFERNGAPFPPHEGLLSPGWTHDPSADNTFYAASVRETGFGKGGRLIGTFCPAIFKPFAHTTLLYLRAYPVWIVNFEVSNEKEVLEEKIEKKGEKRERAFLYPSSFESWFCWLNKFTKRRVRFTLAENFYSNESWFYPRSQTSLVT